MLNKVKYSIVCGIWAMLTISIMMIVSDIKDDRFAVIMIFFIVSYVVGLVLMLTQAGFKKDDSYLKIAPVIILNGYMIIESIISTVLVIVINQISMKTIINVDIIVICIAGLLYMGSIGGNEHISKIEMRQKDHHKEV